MNVGLLDTLGSRYLRFWEPYLRDLGVEVVRPSLIKEDAYRLGQESLVGEPPQAQLALGRILEFGRVDAVLLPALTGVEGDPWGEAFADVLARRVSSLPALLSVPASGEGVATSAADLGARLTHNPGMVRRALEKNRPLLAAPRETMPGLSTPGGRTVAVIGPEALLAEPFLLGELPAQLAVAGLFPVYSTQLPRAAVLERGLRAGGGTPGERELAGAQSVLEGKSAVRGLIFAVPARSAPTRKVAERLAAGAHKPALVLEVAPERSDWDELRAFAARVNAPASARMATEGGSQ